MSMSWAIDLDGAIDTLPDRFDNERGPDIPETPRTPPKNQPGTPEILAHRRHHQNTHIAAFVNTVPEAQPADAKKSQHMWRHPQADVAAGVSSDTPVQPKKRSRKQQTYNDFHCDAPHLEVSVASASGAEAAIIPGNTNELVAHFNARSRSRDESRRPSVSSGRSQSSPAVLGPLVLGPAQSRSPFSRRSNAETLTSEQAGLRSPSSIGSRPADYVGPIPFTEGTGLRSRSYPDTHTPPQAGAPQIPGDIGSRQPGHTDPRSLESVGVPEFVMQMRRLVGSIVRRRRREPRHPQIDDIDSSDEEMMLELCSLLNVIAIMNRDIDSSGCSSDEPSREMQ